MSCSTISNYITNFPFPRVQRMKQAIFGSLFVLLLFGFFVEQAFAQVTGANGGTAGSSATGGVGGSGGFSTSGNTTNGKNGTNANGGGDARGGRSGD
jgi:hypothetical protein